MGKTVFIKGLGIALIVGSVGWLLTTSMGEGMEYFRHADEVIAQQKELAGHKMRMGGFVEKGSIAQKPGTLDYTFEVRPIPEMIKFPEAADKKMRVYFSGVVPDTFKDDAQVIVSGELGKDGSFYGKDLIAKCPSKYEAQMTEAQLKNTKGVR